MYACSRLPGRGLLESWRGLLSRFGDVGITGDPRDEEFLGMLGVRISLKEASKKILKYSVFLAPKQQCSYKPSWLRVWHALDSTFT
jgi:hypothetical protein